MSEGFALRKELADENLKQARMARIEELENQVFEHAGGILGAALSFSEVFPNQTEPPPDWVERYGRQGALQRLEVAKSGWLPASMAPNALKLAAQLWTGVVKGRGYRQGKLVQNNINVKIGLPAPTTREHPGPITYETRDIEE